MNDKETGQVKDRQVQPSGEAPSEKRAVKKVFVKPEVRRYALPAVTYGSFIW